MTTRSTGPTTEGTSLSQPATCRVLQRAEPRPGVARVPNARDGSRGTDGIRRAICGSMMSSVPIAFTPIAFTPSLRRTRVRATVLLAEDDSELRALLEATLARRGHAVHAAPDGREMGRMFSAVSRGELPVPDVVVMDQRMPFFSGLELLRALRLAQWTVPVILMTGFGDHHVRARAQDLGAFELLDKPMSAQRLAAAIERAIASSPA